MELFRFQRAVYGFVALSSFVGIVAWLTMPRKEDPSMPDRVGVVTVRFPGAEPEAVERLVVRPIEDELSEIELLRDLQTTSYNGFCVLKIRLKEHGHGTELDTAWADIESALDRAAVELPDRADPPELTHDLSHTESVVVAVTGSEDLLRLRDAATALKDRMLAVDGVQQVMLTPDLQPRVSIEPSDAALAQLGLSRRTLAAQLQGRAPQLPGGSVRVESRSVLLNPGAEFADLDAIKDTPIALETGGTVPLSEVAQVRFEVPTEEGRVRYRGMPAILVSAIPRDDAHLVALGEQAREVVAESTEELQPLDLEIMSFQPAQVAERLNGLLESLVLGIVLVAGILFLAMGFRMGLVVAVVVPLVAASSLAFYAMGGGVLHQMSVAAFVIALGMLVDNAIVMVDEVQLRIDDGAGPRRAALDALRALGVPLAAATGTTVAAFVPMLLAESATADFTRALPIVVVLTLIVSYLFAVLFTPLLAARFLRRREGGASGGRLAAVSRVVGRFALRRPWTVVGAAVAVVGASAVLGTFLDVSFFPSAGRPEVIVELRHPFGSDFEAIDESARRLEVALGDRPDVDRIATFVGRGPAQIYYNLRVPRREPNSAGFIVYAADPADVEPLREAIRAEALRVAPAAEIVVSRLEQGPPIRAPISIRVVGDDGDALESSVERIRRELRAIEGVRDLRDGLGIGVPSVELKIDDDAALRRGVSRADIALALLDHSHGQPVGELTTGSDAIPVTLRSEAREELDVEQLEAVLVPGQAGTVRLGEVARPELRWTQAVLERYDRERIAVVDAGVESGVPASAVLQELDERLAGVQWPPGIDVEYGGSAEGSADANRALLTTLPIGLILLIVILLAEFNSVRKLMLILVTVPLAAAGIVPGLLLGGQAFGFMSLLGVIALIGIVVNNAIVLVDVVEQRVRAGEGLADAIASAVERRIRPILLTTATTVSGLIPLAFSSAPLWPPMAWSMISGLLASTALTLFVVPSLFRLLFSRQLVETSTDSSTQTVKPQPAE